MMSEYLSGDGMKGNASNAGPKKIWNLTISFLFQRAAAIRQETSRFYVKNAIEKRAPIYNHACCDLNVFVGTQRLSGHE